MYTHIDGLVQDCSKSIAKALELPESCTKPAIYIFAVHFNFLPDGLVQERRNSIADTLESFLH